eukprot:1122217-Karenia_brevis.AAC.1
MEPSHLKYLRGEQDSSHACFILNCGPAYLGQTALLIQLQSVRLHCAYDSHTGHQPMAAVCTLH